MPDMPKENEAIGNFAQGGIPGTPAPAADAGRSPHYAYQKRGEVSYMTSKQTKTNKAIPCGTPEKQNKISPAMKTVLAKRATQKTKISIAAKKNIGQVAKITKVAVSKPVQVSKIAAKVPLLPANKLTKLVELYRAGKLQYRTEDGTFGKLVL